jgi:acyl-CoA synthetase (AMP-forming)/AMP-acid ligase II
LNFREIIFYFVITLLQVKEHPNAPAVSLHGVDTWTYADLDKHSNNLAHAVVSHSSYVSGSTVAILCSRSCEMIACMLGVMKASCAFLTIEDSTPNDRVIVMLKTAQVSLTLTSSKLSSPCPVPTIDVESALAAGGGVFYHQEIQPNDPCYVIFTSGSTGVLCKLFRILQFLNLHLITYRGTKSYVGLTF